jgi:hypothetical protein
MLSGSVCHRDQRWQAREKLSRPSAWRPVRGARTGVNPMPKPRLHWLLGHYPSPRPSTGPLASTGPPGTQTTCVPNPVPTREKFSNFHAVVYGFETAWVNLNLKLDPECLTFLGAAPGRPPGAFMAVFGFSVPAIVRALGGSPLAACPGRSQNPPHHRNTDPGHPLARTHRESH